MKRVTILFISFLILAFLAGIYFCMTYGSPQYIEKITNQTENPESSPDTSCPDLLVQADGQLLLYNTKAPQVPGENPIPFFNLDEYINYLEIQRKKGIKCPILFLKKENDVQGNNVYRAHPSPLNPTPALPATSILYKQPPQKPVAVLDANRDHPPYNANNHAGFDPYGLDQGVYTEIDKIHDSTEVPKTSDNPMDPNWGGVKFTQKSVESGKYAENEVVKPRFFGAKTGFNPNLYQGPGVPPPPPIDA